MLSKLKLIFIAILLFYSFALLQTSFLTYFSVGNFTPNLILISVILFNLFTSKLNYGVIIALIGGFFLDIFSSNFIGLWSLILLLIAFLIKFFLKRYVQIPSAKFFI
jgi:rod shape-determining protein MreD